MHWALCACLREQEFVVAEKGGDTIYDRLKAEDQSWEQWSMFVYHAQRKNSPPKSRPHKTPCICSRKMN